MLQYLAQSRYKSKLWNPKNNIIHRVMYNWITGNYLCLKQIVSVSVITQGLGGVEMVVGTGGWDSGAVCSEDEGR